MIEVSLAPRLDPYVRRFHDENMDYADSRKKPRFCFERNLSRHLSLHDVKFRFVPSVTNTSFLSRIFYKTNIL